jgi:hypothetical protein
MTDKDAALEAVRRWGENGFVKHRRDGLGLKPYAVGKQDGDLFLSVGEGTSWEAAFEEAGQRGAAGRCDPPQR